MIKLKNPKKKALGLLGAVILAALMLPLFAAYEAHVINVKAHIENALKVSPKHIDFGTVFPQETLSASFTVALSDSFMDQGQRRVKDVEYKIVQKLKPIPDSSPTATYKDLRPFLYKTKVEQDQTTDTENGASLDKSIGDIADDWNVFLNVPCIEGALCQDHGLHSGAADCPSFPCGGPHFTACQSVPEDTSGSGTAGDFGADIWIEVTGFSYGSGGGGGGSNDTIIDADGAITPFVGVPIDVTVGTALTNFPGAPSSGVDLFDRDASGGWSNGDDLHSEETRFGGIRNAIYEPGFDLLLRDDNGDLAAGTFVSFDLDGSGPALNIRFHDLNGSGSWEPGEDIIHDVNGNGIYD